MCQKCRDEILQSKQRVKSLFGESAELLKIQKERERIAGLMADLTIEEDYREVLEWDKYDCDEQHAG